MVPVLKFSLPHEKKHLLDFASQLKSNIIRPNDTGSNVHSNIGSDCIAMNIDTIYSNLKSNYCDFYHIDSGWL